MLRYLQWAGSSRIRWATSKFKFCREVARAHEKHSENLFVSFEIPSLFLCSPQPSIHKRVSYRRPEKKKNTTRISLNLKPQRISEQLHFMFPERHLWAAHLHFQFTCKTTFLSALILKYSLSSHAVLSRLLGSSLCRTGLYALLPCPRIVSHFPGAAMQSTFCTALKVHFGGL